MDEDSIWSSKGGWGMPGHATVSRHMLVWVSLLAVTVLILSNCGGSDSGSGGSEVAEAASGDDGSANVSIEAAGLAWFFTQESIDSGWCETQSAAEAALERFQADLAANPTDQIASLATLLRHFYCLDLAGLQRWDSEISAGIDGTCEKWHAALNPALLVADLLQHTGDVAALESLSTDAARCAASYPIDRLYMDDFGTGAMVTIPSGSPGLDRTMGRVVQLVVEPEHLGFGLCQMTDNVSAPLGTRCNGGLHEGLCSGAVQASLSTFAPNYVFNLGISGINLVSSGSGGSFDTISLSVARDEWFGVSAVEMLDVSSGSALSAMCPGESGAGGVGGVADAGFGTPGMCLFRFAIQEIQQARDQLLVCDGAFLDPGRFDPLVNPATENPGFVDPMCAVSHSSQRKGSLQDQIDDALARSRDPVTSAQDRDLTEGDLADLIEIANSAGADVDISGVDLTSLTGEANRLRDDATLYPDETALNKGEGRTPVQRPRTRRGTYEKGRGIGVRTDQEDGASLANVLDHEAGHFVLEELGVMDGHEPIIRAWRDSKVGVPSPALERLMDEATSEEAKKYVDDLLGPEDEPSTGDPNTTTPRPDDDTGGCGTEAGNRAQAMFECLRAHELASAEERTMGWGPLAPYVYVLDPPPVLTTTCEEIPKDYNGPDGWTDPPEDGIEVLQAIPSGTIDYNGPGGWTDPCQDPDICSGMAVAGVFESRLAFGDWPEQSDNVDDLLDALEIESSPHRAISTFSEFSVHSVEPG